MRDYKLKGSKSLSTKYFRLDRKQRMFSGKSLCCLAKICNIGKSFLCPKTMPKQTNSHSASLTVTPASDDSSLSLSSFEKLLFQITNKNAAAKKQSKGIDSSTKVITSKEWIMTEKLKIKYEEEKTKVKEIKSLNKYCKGKEATTTTKKVRQKMNQIMILNRKRKYQC